jgi:hypothetical protein
MNEISRVQSGNPKLPRLVKHNVLLLKAVRSGDVYRDCERAGRLKRALQLKRLAKRGLVRLTVDGIWCLTPQGRAALEPHLKR